MKKQPVHGERIEEIRKDMKLSQRELAAQAGISYDALRRVENGETNTINSDMLIRLAEFFEVSTDYLLGLSNIRERRNYAVSQLGLSEESIKRLVSKKIDHAAGEDVSASADVEWYAGYERAHGLCHRGHEECFGNRS